MVLSFRVIIFGSWDKTWMTALNPESEVWLNLPMVKEVLVVPDTDVAHISTSTNSNLVTVLLPLMEWHIVQCPTNYLALISSEKTIKTLWFKHELDNYLSNCFLSHLAPRAYKNIGEVSYPFILKRVDLNSGNGILLVKSAGEIPQYAKQEFWINKPVILQEYIESNEEYVTHLVCKNGEILWHASLKFTLEDKQVIRSPFNVKRTERVATREKFLDQFSSCLRPLNFNGPCNIDYKIAANGDLKIMEINPRFGGTLMLKESTDLLQDALRTIFSAVSRI